MAKRMGLACILFACAGTAHAQAPQDTLPISHQSPFTGQDQSRGGLSGPDQSPACAAAGGIGSDTDCRRNGVQIDPMSGRALSADDQCTSMGGVSDGEACFRDGAQIDPNSGAALQPGIPGYVPQVEDDITRQGQPAPP